MKFDSPSDYAALLLGMTLCPLVFFVAYAGLKRLGNVICDYKERHNAKRGRNPESN